MCRVNISSIVEICDGLKVRFVDAGHLLGSSSIEMWIREDDEEVKVVFSGDIGNGNRPLIKDPQYIKDADYVVMESTYGDKEHETPPDYAAALAGGIEGYIYKGWKSCDSRIFRGKNAGDALLYPKGSRQNICCRSLRISRCLSIVRWQWRQPRSLIRMWRTVSARKH